MCYTTDLLSGYGPSSRLIYAKLHYANYDYDSGGNTDFEYASSDIYIYANYDGSDGNADCSDASSDFYINANCDYDSDDNADCHDASSDNYYI